MPLALFDLDNTLLAHDSDYLWGRFLVDNRLVDVPHYEETNRTFYQDYRLGRLNIHDYLVFQLGVLAQLAHHDKGRLFRWRTQFVEEKIVPIVAPQARSLLQWHQNRGDTLVIITATNRFVTEPIAALLGVDHLIATEPEETGGRFTGQPTGTPCFREGKIERLTHWMKITHTTLQGSWFYSDSLNDVPLLERVDHPVAVDPDDTLRHIAGERKWPIMSLRAATFSHGHRT